jgi:hypothetical protein
MPDYLSARKAWLLLATHFEAIGMPKHVDGSPLDGLCGCVDYLVQDKVIDHFAASQMRARIWGALPPGRRYLERPSQAKPRIKWCLKFAKACEKEGDND